PRPPAGRWVGGGGAVVAAAIFLERVCKLPEDDGNGGVDAAL
ncbi:DUF3180 domain-containing protein, partial [Streptomyces inhibens]